MTVHNFYQELALLLTEIMSQLNQGQWDGKLWHDTQLLWQEHVVTIVDDQDNSQHQRLKTELYRSWRLLKTAVMFAQMSTTPNKWHQVNHHLKQVIGYCEAITS